MSDQFDSLDATEKAAVEAGLNRCRTLVAQIQSELRNMRPEHFVNKSLLADFLRLLAGAAGVLSECHVCELRRQAQAIFCRRLRLAASSAHQQPQHQRQR